MGVQESDPLSQLSLPPGFRFHPTDEELISQYLCRKEAGHHFSSQIIGDIDLDKFYPWASPSKAIIGEQEWYFLNPRDRKYPNGSRPNRVTGSGYWKATGTDKYSAARYADYVLPDLTEGGRTDGDKNTNKGGGVSIGDTTIEGGVSIGNSNIKGGISIGNTTVNLSKTWMRRLETRISELGTQISRLGKQISQLVSLFSRFGNCFLRSMMATAEQSVDKVK